MSVGNKNSNLAFINEVNPDKALRPQTIEEFLAANAASSLLRFSTAGSVDDGKSTLIGRLLHDSKNIYEDTLRSIEKLSTTNEPLPLALLTDGLKAEREQGITIDVAYRYFSTPKRHFILADSPGHEQYTRNMATGASTADLTIILIDARKGVITQTRRHSFIASLLGVPRLLVTINKMDLVDYSETVFENIKRDFIEFARRLSIKDIRFVPVSALQGDNIVSSSNNMPWYHGETVMQYLENIYIGGDSNLVDFRFPIQYVIRPHQNFRGYAGQIRSGMIRVGEEVMVLPSKRISHIKSINIFSDDPSKTEIESANAPMSVVLTLTDEIDISRGDLLVRPKNIPSSQHQLDAMVVWMSETPLDLSRHYILLHTTRESKCMIDEIQYKIDVNSLSRLPGAALQLNEIGRLKLTSKKPIFADSYQNNRATGNFILVDEESFQTVAAGLILDRGAAEEVTDIKKLHLHNEESLVTLEEREAKLGLRAVTYWCTGLSGSGKSTIAKALERRLFDSGKLVYRLDGDNLRQGINKNLGFSKADRSENIRRTAEIAKLFNSAGITVICSLISPLASDRESAKEVIGEDRFVEIYVNTPIATCEERDPHGLYKKARAGEIKEFTGITAPYEPPTAPAIELDSSKLSVEESVTLILEKNKCH